MATLDLAQATWKRATAACPPGTMPAGGAMLSAVASDTNPRDFKTTS